MLRAMIAAAVVHLLVAIDENLSGAFAVATSATAVRALGLFCVVVKRPPQLKDQLAVEVEAGFDEGAFYLFQGYLHQVVAYTEQGRLLSFRNQYSLDTREQERRGFGLVRVRVQLCEGNLPLLYNFRLFGIHIGKA